MIVDKIPETDEKIIQLLKYNTLSVAEMVHFLREVKDKRLRDDYIATLKEPLRIYIIDGIIRLCGSEEEKEAWNKKIVEITDITKLNLEDLEKMPDDTMIRICGEYTGSWQRQLYTKDTYIKIVNKIDEIFGNIKSATKDDIKSEIITFMQVCSKICKIRFDERTMVRPGINDPELGVSSRNLEGGVLDNTCVCEGYSELLRNALISKGIDAKFIKGTIKDGSTHAWNQVKIGGHWFNVDLTWAIKNHPELVNSENPFIIELLQTDEEFSEHDKYELYRPKEEKKCKKRIQELIRESGKEIEL
ncbi:MAG: hypothetical protein IKR04_06715 [Clostridia bacterium]|nr:hypothetical protein [Clostridia bacterium]